MSAGQFLVPCQLPDPPAWLAGRDAEINALDQMLAAPEGWPLTVVVSGVPGVGKTALASWWLHEHRRQFSEGQFYARLAGPLGMGETPWEVLGRWLRAFGVPTVSIPASRAGRERLWKAMTAGRRLAIMIDDAPSASAVEALVPGQGTAGGNQPPDAGGRVADWLQAAPAAPAEAPCGDRAAGPAARPNGDNPRYGFAG